MTEATAEAIERLEAILRTERDPRGRAFAPISELLRTSGRLVEARVRVEVGTAADPEFASGHMVAARIYADLDLDHLARAAVGRVLALDPDNAEATVLAVALDPIVEESALEWARAQGEGPPVASTEGEVLTVTMGDLYLSQGAPDRAVALFERMLADDPGNEVVRARLRRARGGPSPLEEAVAVESLAPAPEAAEAPAVVAVGDLAPAVVPVDVLAPRIVPVTSLAPDRDAANAADAGGSVDEFMSWLDDQ